MNILKKLIINELKQLIQRFEQDDCEIDSQTATDILSVISHQVLSKMQACDVLHISRSKFDKLINQGKLPPGRKIIGFNELIWYKDELLNKINNLKNE